MYRIDDSLKEFVESGVSAIVGTGDAAQRPHIALGWAPRVLDDRVTVELFLDAARAERTLANLSATGRIALTMAAPVSARSVQLKGTFVETTPTNDADRDWVRDRREAFRTACALIGDPPSAVVGLWMEETVRVAFTAEAAFDQTPGPNAGRPL